MENIFTEIGNLIKNAGEILETPLAELSALHFIFLVVFMIGLFFLSKAMFRALTLGWTETKKVGRKVRTLLSAKRRASKITCNHCGRPLTNCSCEMNKKKSYGKRIRNYKKEKKQRKKRALEQFRKSNK